MTLRKLWKKYFTVLCPGNVGGYIAHSMRDICPSVTVKDLKGWRYYALICYFTDFELADGLLYVNIFYVYIM